MRRASSLKKILMLGKIEGKGRQGHQRMSWLDSIMSSREVNLSKVWEIVEDRGARYAIANSLLTQMVKSLPAMQETQVQSLGQEDPLEKEMATHYSILAWKIPWWKILGVYSPWGCKELDNTTEWLHFTYEVTKSWTQLGNWTRTALRPSNLALVNISSL